MLGAAGGLAARNERPLAIAAALTAIGCAAVALGEWRRSRGTRSRGRSQAITRAALRPLARHGWKVSHTVAFAQAGQDTTVDHLVLGSDGELFAIQTAARSYTSGDLARTLACAEHAARERRVPDGAYGVLCVAGGRSCCEVEQGVIVCSPDRLHDAIVSTAATGMALAQRGPGSGLQALGRWLGA